ncbi:type II secretion system F family protein [Anaerovorax odorimutans]|uniref:type II secretion system F family protein n=1 Tax=Anaerovorax odorimutans TaxID=109327 RepID=UPI000421AD26|nr:type II secretion system F family protein [Anaerovorax odorimutans]
MKGKKYKDILKIFIEWLMPKLPDWIIGKTTVLEMKFRERYGDRNCIEYINKIKYDNLKRYIVIISLFLLFILLIVVDNFINLDGKVKKEGNLTYINRPVIGDKAETVDVHVELEHEDTQMEKDVQLSVKTKKLTNKQKSKILKNYADKLPKIILGENKSDNEITKELNLVEKDKENGIVIKWTSNNPDIIGETGQVDSMSVSKGKKVILTAELILDDLTYEKEINLRVIPAKDNVDVKNILECRLAALTDELADNRDNNYLVLPNNLQDNIKIRWSDKKSNDITILIIIFVLLILIIFKNRYVKIDKEIKTAKESMLNDFPDFVNKLVLLLNAGLVPTTALLKISNDYADYHCEEKVLYAELCEIQRKVDGTNLSVISELKNFAQRCGIREFMRFSAIIAENINKGSTLAEKLESESELLWLNRKKNAEERGRLAETKLTLPLLILLLVLIVITIVPALIEM